MKTKHGLILVTLVAVAVACEDTDPTAPTGSTITVTASPAAVNIDQLTGQTQGQTTIVAQVIDPNGLPINDIPLLVTSTGGLLSSVNNFCGPLNFCTRTGDLCAVDSDCPPPPPPSAVVTNENGVATDVLTLRLFGDPNQVTVTVKGTNLEGSALVDKVVNNGPADPIPVIVAQPGSGQRTGLPFKFNGSSSIFDPNVEPTCYDWKITSSLPVFASNAGAVCTSCIDPPSGANCVAQCVARGPNSIDAIVELTIGTVGTPQAQLLDQTMSVTLRVSDDPTIACNGSAADNPKFGPNIVSINYDLDCDTSDPSANAGSDKVVSLIADGSGGTVSVSLDGTATDPEDVPPLVFLWDCGTGGTCVPGACNTQSVTCQYSSTGVRTATFTAINDCNRQDTDSVQVNVQP